MCSFSNADLLVQKLDACCYVDRSILKYAVKYAIDLGRASQEMLSCAVNEYTKRATEFGVNTSDYIDIRLDQLYAELAKRTETAP